MLCYGLTVTAQDGWHEQVVKRGWTLTGLPDVLTPKLPPGWLGVLVARRSFSSSGSAASTAPPAADPAVPERAHGRLTGSSARVLA